MNLTIEIDEGSGFCFGVTTAIKKAEEELAKGNELYCLGDIVHNGMEVSLPIYIKVRAHRKKKKRSTTFSSLSMQARIRLGRR